MCQGMMGISRSLSTLAGDERVIASTRRASTSSSGTTCLWWRLIASICSAHNRWRVEFGGNVWVKDGFAAPSPDDTALAGGAAVLRRPDIADPRTADWTAVGPAEGKGAAWPLDTR